MLRPPPTHAVIVRTVGAVVGARNALQPGHADAQSGCDFIARFPGSVDTPGGTFRAPVEATRFTIRSATGGGRRHAGSWGQGLPGARGSGAEHRRRIAAL